jgi:hypothetical protein
MAEIPFRGSSRYTGLPDSVWRYVRDNIHVSLLAKAYAAVVGANPPPGTVRRLNPSGYV